MPEQVDVIMPLEEGRNIPGDVLTALTAQDVPVTLWVSTSVGDGQFADARNHIKQYGASRYVLMLDNDVAMPRGSLAEMCRFLDAQERYAAIGLCKHSRLRFATDDDWLTAPHVDMSCVLFRGDVLKRLTFLDRGNAARLKRKSRGCECTNCCRDIREMGLRIGFLPNVYAGHLHESARSRGGSHVP